MPDVVEHPKRQRLAAYALITRPVGGDLEVLLTRMSGRTRIEGHWTLPGGGVDHGEDPRQALVREVHEETGLYVDPGRVLDVHSTHFVGERADGLVENYHGVHLIFEATVRPESDRTELHVVEEDSSTAEAAWVPVAMARTRPLLSAAQHALDNLVQPGG